NNGHNPFLIHFGLEYENEQANFDKKTGIYPDIRRKPFHVCAWRGELARSESFSDDSTQEDWEWASRLCKKAKTQHRIDRVLHYYHYSDATTAAAKAREMDTKSSGA